jgi:hypothetical protein
VPPEETPEPIPGAIYISVSLGSDSNKGTFESPYRTINRALSENGGGRLYIVRDGVYTLQTGLNNVQIPSIAAGTSLSPTIIRSENRWGAIIDGAFYHGISSEDGVSHIEIDGFRVRNVNSDGIKLNGSYCTVKNCWVHNNGHMGISFHGESTGWSHALIERNLVEGNGTSTQFDHGMYLGGDYIVVRNNVIRNNRSFGLHLYPSFKYGQVYQNLVYSHNFKQGVVLSDGVDTVFKNNTIVDNVGSLVLYSMDCNFSIVNNIFTSYNHVNTIDGSVDSWGSLIDYNLFSPPTQFKTAYLALLGPNNVTSDPHFANRNGHLYYLQSDSPGFSMSLVDIFAEEDFWGRAQSQRYAGAFPLVEPIPSFTDDIWSLF